MQPVVDPGRGSFTQECCWRKTNLGHFVCNFVTYFIYKKKGFYRRSRGKMANPVKYLPTFCRFSFQLIFHPCYPERQKQHSSAIFQKALGFNLQTATTTAACIFIERYTIWCLEYIFWSCVVKWVKGGEARYRKGASESGYGESKWVVAGSFVVCQEGAANVKNSCRISTLPRARRTRKSLSFLSSDSTSFI